MDAVEKWHYEALAAKAVEALKKNGFDARVAKDGKEAADIVLGFVKPGIKVGMGGSMTVKDLGLGEAMAKAGAIILDHNAPGLSAEQKRDIRVAQLDSDLFVSGSNAITLEGEIVNVDGNGNRVAALSFGPRKVVVVVGANKIVSDLDEAFARIELYAAPMNCKRLSLANPCATTGECADCRSATRICNIYHIMRRKPAMADFTVVVMAQPGGY